MRKLLKKAFEIPLYHGTGVNKLKAITDSGMMMPQESGGGGRGSGDSSSFEGYTFFATERFKAIGYADWVADGVNDFPVVIEAALPESSLMPDDDDCPNCKTWQESAEKIKQVKVLGSIDTTYFTTIHFVNPGNYEVAFSCPFRNWEAEYEKNKSKITSEETVASVKIKRLIKKGE